jgi:hypothetical protein
MYNIQILFLSSFTPRGRAVFQNTLGVGTDGFKRPSLQMLYSPNLNYYRNNYRPDCYVTYTCTILNIYIMR